MIDPMLCLAVAIYFEAGNQPLQGKVAVAHVIMNRVMAEEYPNAICTVVKQRRQFSFYWDGKPEHVPRDFSKMEMTAWLESLYVSMAMLSEGGDGSHIEDITQGALHYAATYVDKPWMAQLTPIKIGQHIFYR